MKVGRKMLNDRLFTSVSRSLRALVESYNTRTYLSITAANDRRAYGQSRVTRQVEVYTALFVFAKPQKLMSRREF